MKNSYVFLLIHCISFNQKKPFRTQHCLDICADCISLYTVCFFINSNYIVTNIYYIKLMSTDKNRPWEAACMTGTSCQAKRRHRHPGRETQLSTPSAPPAWKEATHTPHQNVRSALYKQIKGIHKEEKKRETVKHTGNNIFRSAGVTQRRKYSKYKPPLVQLCFVYLCI